MVDAADLKSVDCKNREGSSPSTPIIFFVIFAPVFLIELTARIKSIQCKYDFL